MYSVLFCHMYSRSINYVQYVRIDLCHINPAPGSSRSYPLRSNLLQTLQNRPQIRYDFGPQTTSAGLLQYMVMYYLGWLPQQLWTDRCQAKDEYKTSHEGLDSLSWLQYSLVHSNRCHCLSLLSFLELLVSLSCTGGVANVNGGLFLPGLGSFLLSETFFQCPPEPSGRRLRSGGNNIVCAWYPARYSSHALHRLWHYSRQRFRHIYCHFEFLRNRFQPPWQKIRYLLQQVSSSTFPQVNS